MPKSEKIDSTDTPISKDQEIRDTVEQNLDILNENPGNMDIKKSITCVFYRRGGLADCFGCPQTDQIVTDCTEEYIDLMQKRPALVYSDDLLSPISRPKVSLASGVASELGLHCDSCYISDKCPVYKKGYACGIDWGETVPKSNAELVAF